METLIQISSLKIKDNSLTIKVFSSLPLTYNTNITLHNIEFKVDEINIDYYHPTYTLVAIKEVTTMSGDKALKIFEKFKEIKTTI